MRNLEAEWTAAMRRDDFEAAWSLSDEALAARDPATRDDPRRPYHLRWVWDGRPVRDRRVLVRCYHGLGDTLQFARYLPALARVAASVAVEVQPELLSLLAGIPGPDHLIPFAPHAPAPSSECDVEIMELAHALRLRPPPPPYLRASPAPHPGATGLCWEAGGWDPARCVPPELFAPLLDGSCVCLQPRPTTLPVLNPRGCPADVAATAALIAGLEQVVTVDTMVAHLAGALGRPTWLLLKHDADWRWGAGERSVWYPSMRLCRQPWPGGWASAVDRVVSEVRSSRSCTGLSRPARTARSG